MRERIKELRRFLKLTQKDFAESISTSPQNITKYESGQIQPSSDLLLRLYTQFSVNLHWLITGEGTMFSKYKKNETDFDFVCENHNKYGDSFLSEISTVFANMPEERKKECLQFCKEKKLLSDLLQERLNKSAS